MRETGVRFIVSDNFLDLNDIPSASFYKTKRAKERSSQSSVSSPPPAPMTTTLYGFKIQPIQGLGERSKSASLWETVLGSLLTGYGFEISKKDYHRARKAIQKYNKEAKKIWKEDRKFTLEINVNANGEDAPGIGRVGRIK